MPEAGARTERGAAAVEFALVSTLLIMLVLGICEFGYAFFQRGTLAGAAREAARSYAIHKDVGRAERAAEDSAEAAGISGDALAFNGFGCGAGGNVTVRISYHHHSLTGFFGPGWTMTATGVMRCGG